MRDTMIRRRKRASDGRARRRAAERVTDTRSVGAANTGVVDLARVVEARRRIASGWYDRSDVRDSLVDAVLHEILGR